MTSGAEFAEGFSAYHFCDLSFPEYLVLEVPSQ